ncbi:MAG: toxin-antitoxin system YwqK family antitoxin [Bacteroidales bacterium]|nr:toxin-antitoxin system YwqK family antitoxin [Bacteroidales bacterium]MDP2238433.1 toxin-antitoxin system YwqK family antitoxin [Bacteroidales bacterium]
MKKKLLFASKLLYLITFVLILVSCNGKVKKSYYDNGNLRSILQYEDGKLNGHCEWFHENGRLQMESEYVLNSLHGKQTRYYENGVIQSVAFYKNNLLDSVNQQFSINGKLIQNETYRRDSLHGLFQRFYERGQIMVDGQYESGMMHGEWLFYDTGGAIVGRASFDMGSGLQKGWHPNGKLSRVIHYKDNLRHGAEEYYNFEGKLHMIRYYEYGDLVREELVDNQQ